MVQKILIAKHNTIACNLLTNMANRHGLITGATGTGKTITLHALAEQFSNLGVPVFLADVKGDLSGISQVGNFNDKILNLLASRNIEPPVKQDCPTVFWDVFAEKGLPIRTTIANMGALLLSRMLNLNDTQSGILDIVFKIAQEENLDLVDLKDLRTLLQFVGDNADKFKTAYGNVSKASIGAIQRSLLQIQSQGGELFFAEPALNINDLFRTTANGKGYVNVLMAEKLMLAPRLYSTVLLWLLTQLFEFLPEVGDPELPKMVFFFDEAHLLFNDAPAVLLEKIELVVRLVRSKGVGVFFISQNPSDIPDNVLSQLGNRIQHALRAFTPKDQKAIRATAQTMRPNPELNIEQVITELAVGEALVSFLDEKATPSITQRVFIIPPGSQIGPITEEQRRQQILNSNLYASYAKTIERQSAHEILTANQGTPNKQTNEQTKSASDGLTKYAKDVLFGSTGPRGGKRDGIVQSVIKSNLRSIINKLIKSFFNGKR